MLHAPMTMQKKFQILLPNFICENNMKIIKQGKIPAEREYRVTCRTCDTVFQFAQSEGKVTSDQRDGDFVSIACPTCGKIASAALVHYVNP